jgi:signal transduction histidine kinase
MKLDLSRSLRKKLIGVILLTTLSALVVALLAIVAYDLRAYHRGWTADMATQAELLGRMSVPALAFDDPDVAEETLGLLHLRPPIQAAAIYTARGELFASYSRAGLESAFPGLPEGDGARVEGRNLVLFKRIVDGTGIVGTVYLRADYELLGRVGDYAGISAVVIALAMLVAFILSAQLQRIVTRPILAIADVARDVMRDRDYSRRADKHGKDEVGVLVDSFNGMLAEIERRTEDLLASNIELEREVAVRARAEMEVTRLNAELEARVRDRTAQLESANHELESFCYSVSHDLRAPLRSIDGFSQALLEDFPRDVPENAQRYLDRIRAATKRMGQLIEDLLNLSNVSRGTLERSEFDLGELARNVIDDIRQRDPERRADVVVRGAMMVQADRRLVQAALENLLANAWKFTSKTENPRIEVGVIRDGDLATYFVRDNGAGFDMAYVGKLFAPFQRLHGADEYAGTGIGLATVQRIVHRHGGRIWADAGVGAGAAFYFTLAADSIAQPGPSPESGARH